MAANAEARKQAVYADFLTQKGQLIGYLRAKKAEFETLVRFVDLASPKVSIPAFQASYAQYAAEEKPGRTTAVKELQRLGIYLRELGVNDIASLEDVERLWDDLEAVEEAWARALTDAAAEAYNKSAKVDAFSRRCGTVVDWCRQNLAQLAACTSATAAADFAAKLQSHLRVMDAEYSALAEMGTALLPHPGVDDLLRTLSEVSIGLTFKAYAALRIRSAGTRGGNVPIDSNLQGSLLHFFDGVESLLALAADDESRDAVSPVMDQLPAIRAEVLRIAPRDQVDLSVTPVADEHLALLERLVTSKLTTGTYVNPGFGAAAAARAATKRQDAFERRLDEVRSWVRLANVPHPVSRDNVTQDWTGLYTALDQLKGHIATEMGDVLSK